MTRNRKHINPKHQPFTTVCASTTQQPELELSTLGVFFAARKRTSSTAPHPSVHQSPLPPQAIDAKISFKGTQVASHAWIHVEYPQWVNYSQTEALRIVPTTEEGLLPQSSLGGKKKSFRNCNTPSGLPHAPWLLTKKVLTGIESFYWSSLSLKVQAPKYA